MNRKEKYQSLDGFEKRMLENKVKCICAEFDLQYFEEECFCNEGDYIAYLSNIHYLHLTMKQDKKRAYEQEKNFV